MVQHADRERIVKLARERQLINVRLNDVRIFQMARGGKSSFHRVAQIDADYFARAPTRGELRVTALSAAAFQHDLVLEKLGTDRRDPAEKLIRVELVALREVLPLPTEIFGGGGFVCPISSPAASSAGLAKRGMPRTIAKLARARIAGEFARP